jgi:hypothetical protein
MAIRLSMLIFAALLGFAPAAIAGIPLQTGGPNMACPANDQANACVSGSFAATGNSGIFAVQGYFNGILYGNNGPNGAWTGSVQLERSFDGGTTWIVAGVGGGGGQAVFTTGMDVSFVGYEPERGVLYRFHCTSLVSGHVNYRFSTSQPPSFGSSPIQ